MLIDLLRLVFASTNLILYVIAPVRFEASQATGRFIDIISQLYMFSLDYPAFSACMLSSQNHDQIRVLSRAPISPLVSNVLCTASYQRACCSMYGA